MGSTFVPKVRRTASAIFTPPAGWRHTRSVRWTRVVASALTVLCVVVLTSAGTLRATVLNHGFYQDVLDDQRAYDRLYDEVLVDTEAQPVTKGLLARMPVPEGVVTANLKTVLPAPTVRQLTDEQIAALVAYLRGDTSTLRLSVDLTPVLANLNDLGKLYLGNLVSDSEERTDADLDAALKRMDSALDDVSAGRKPDLPRVGLSGTAVDKATKLLLAGVPESEHTELRPQVRGALAVGDVATALAAVGPHLPGTTAGSGDREAQRDLVKIADGGRWNVADDLRDSGADLGALESARGITHLWLGLVQILAAVLGVVAIAFLWVSGPRRRIRRLRNLGGLLVAGSVPLALAFLLAKWKGDTWVWTPPATWPPSLSSLVGDLERTGIQYLANAGLIISLAPLAMGLLLSVLSAVWERRASGRKLAPRRRKVLLGGVTAGVTTTAVLAPVLLPTAAQSSQRIYCNGSAELCDLRYDQAAYLASHNAMSSTANKFISPLQDADITTQLDHGARALLIDTHTWERRDEIAQRLKLSEFAPDMQREISGVIDKASPARPGLWLCHAICRAGAVPLVETLSDVGQWLDDHPGEVVTLIVEDGVSGKETASAFRQAGVEDLLYTPDDDPGSRWPTLGEMVENDSRLVVFSEQSDGPAPWYRNFYRYGMETPYSFSSPAAMSCAPNRGGRDKRLFLLNHFITHGGGSRIDSAEVNAKDFVLNRAHRCESERGAPVNFVAVDFANLGNAQGAVDALNEARIRER